MAADVWELLFSADEGSALAAVLWLGIGPGALAACLQTYGQKRMLPAQAQVIGFLNLRRCLYPDGPSMYGERHTHLSTAQDRV